MASRPKPDPPAVGRGRGDALAELASARRWDEALRGLDDADDTAVVALADALVEMPSRTALLDVDVALVRLLQDVLDRLPKADLVRRSRVATRSALELRGDPSTTDERRTLLDLAEAEAQESGDEVAHVDALMTRVHALWEPTGVGFRLHAAERVIARSRQIRAVDYELEGRLARIDALIQLGRVRDAELELATYARLAEPVGRADLNTFVASRRATLALIRGRYDLVLEHAEDAYNNAVAAGMRDADRLRMSYVSAVAFDCSETDDFAAAVHDLLRDMAEQLPGHFIEADVALSLYRLGRVDEARAELARLMPSLTSTTGYRWLFSACHAADVAAHVCPPQTCAQLHELLAPYADLFASLGPMFGGSVRQRLGLLELSTGRVEEAVVSLRQAVAELDQIAALPWAARARIDLAVALREGGDPGGADAELAYALDIARGLGMKKLVAELSAPLPSDATTWRLREDGEDWILVAGAEEARLRGGRGFAQLRLLLANPRQDIAAHRLEAGDAPAPSPGLPVLDARAKADYRRRLDAIDEELERADRRGDRDTAKRLEQERVSLVDELRRATGLGGRDRTIDDDAERARVNVTRNIKRAIAQIEKAAPLAAAHLAGSVRTGYQCRYDPEPGGPASWRID